MADATHDLRRHLRRGRSSSPPPADRAAYLDRACGDDAALRRRSSGCSPPTPGRQLPGRPGRPELDRRRSTTGRRRGPGTVDRPVQAAGADRRGRHGRGLHGRAAQPVRRKVALKVIKPGMDTPAGGRPVRGRAAGPGADGPPEHRQGARRRGDRRGPAVLRHGAGPGRPDHRATATEHRLRRGSGWSCSSRSARRCSTPTRRGSSTATSSRRNVLVADARRHAGAQGDRLRGGQGDRPAADRQDAVHRRSPSWSARRCT